jgi:hypothetical protein
MLFHIKQAVPFPSFHDVRNDLLLEEITMGAKAIFDSAMTFATSGGQQSRPPPSPAPFGGPYPPP